MQTPSIFVNLPVSDLKKAEAFYEALGFKKNPMFSSEDTTGMVFSETIHLMIMVTCPSLLPSQTATMSVLLSFMPFKSCAQSLTYSPPDQEHHRFQSFMPANKTLVCGRDGTETLLALVVAKKEDVDKMVEGGADKGGKRDPTKLPEMEGHYGRSVEDPDGHIWEVGCMTGLAE
jgi:predicted lactoylglutathione lyase